MEDIPKRTSYNIIFSHATEETHEGLFTIEFWKEQLKNNPSSFEQYQSLLDLDIYQAQFTFKDYDTEKGEFTYPDIKTEEELRAKQEEAINKFAQNQILKCENLRNLLNTTIYPYTKKYRELPPMFIFFFGNTEEETERKTNNFTTKLLNCVDLEGFTEEELNILYANRTDFYSLFQKNNRRIRYAKEKGKQKAEEESAIALRETTQELLMAQTGRQIFSFVQLLNLNGNNNKADRFISYYNSIGFNCTIKQNETLTAFTIRTRNEEQKRGKAIKQAFFSIGYLDFNKIVNEDPDEKERKASQNKLVKIFIYIMNKIKKIDNLPEGKEKDLLNLESKITISIEELIASGIFNNIKVAIREMAIINKILYGLFIAFGSESKNTDILRSEALFTEITRNGNIFEYSLNKNHILRFLNTQMQAPKWIYKLSSNAFVVAFSLFNIARTYNQKSFTYAYKDIQNLLGLPHINDTKNTKRDIKEPILKAIEEINITAKENKKGKKPDIEIIIEDPEAKIKEFLEEGRAKIIINNEDINEFNNSIRLLKNGKDEETIKK